MVVHLRLSNGTSLLAHFRNQFRFRANNGLNSKRPPNRRWFVMGRNMAIGIGVSLGVVLGIIIHSIGLGIIFGVAFGAALAAYYARRSGP